MARHKIVQHGPATAAVTRPSAGWWGLGLCRQVDPELFFPEKGGSTKEAKRICMACEVRVECLQDALDHGERFGIRGGLSEQERRRLERPSDAALGPGAVAS